jgi:hypothetical protein
LLQFQKILNSALFCEILVEVFADNSNNIHHAPVISIDLCISFKPLVFIFALLHPYISSLPLSSSTPSPSTPCITPVPMFYTLSLHPLHLPCVHVFLNPLPPIHVPVFIYLSTTSALSSSPPFPNIPCISPPPQITPAPFLRPLNILPPAPSSPAPFLRPSHLLPLASSYQCSIPTPLQVV